ncbi:PREDICTED: diacylglycerol O-acyltransferase 2-like isoform X1 [Vollenhovia emeryi]|uniref:diacylglycerol O-acyltransferase 2-like isoform X1 n=1 Tax=Vollenhovia emeryi TaxID=411798 RepID=UPI0005F3B8AD|nr:PREDICTED: diacylglycerol O-acyltransferase 2-like isoform X1 [Vollenhovia emeryi]XP_011878993.1 PREDICTED: diacylglycerol O-acyltransferase 2-like isoform X1 [Vollenhovia emeryi]XP_011878994.1 PREDICTED: diacylglycerol O-acyltransferase 2-like isoform X1 [Vollenhovia emeryi]XP_011878996.1 PREDICTED: diacylglycerol O-acyltransferase 2-like isoform X1 [Vollenhovia emeryi]XP_011878997.1 PREDICTED: diacylglycerol O-acyltransferase 2-like isoform X1 [Vollenhovia emeryi]XP_011878998.1 PREDICTED:
MKILGVKFVPLNVPLEKRLQTLAAATWVIVSAFGDAWGYLITAYLLLYTDITRYFLLLYFLWMYYDWDTCHRGGRTELLTKVVRNNVFWRYFCNYFPLKLVKTVNLNPNKSYLFICVPHGILSMGIVGSFATDAMDCKKLFPGLEIHPITLDQHFKVPLIREYVYSLGFCASSVRSLKHLLSTPPKRPYTGKATLLVVGGASESMESTPGTYRVLVKRRKGFVKLALKHGTSLVPVLSFGETDLYNQIYRPEGSTFRRVQNYIRGLIGLAPVVFSGRGFFQYSFGLIPKRLPVTVVVGSPIELPKITDPTPEEINTYHDKFTKQLIELFETQKHNYIKNAEKVTLEFNV